MFWRGVEIHACLSVARRLCDQIDEPLRSNGQVYVVRADLDRVLLTIRVNGAGSDYLSAPAADIDAGGYAGAIAEIVPLGRHPPRHG